MIQKEFTVIKEIVILQQASHFFFVSVGFIHYFRPLITRRPNLLIFYLLFHFQLNQFFFNLKEIFFENFSIYLIDDLFIIVMEPMIFIVHVKH